MPGRRKLLLPLLAALSFAAPAAAAGQELDYVALGDSYAAGTGTASVYPDTCFANPAAAYSNLIDPDLPGSGGNIACGGAVSGNIDMDSQNDRPPQVTRPEIGKGTKFVTLQIGGNDVGFANIVAGCLVQPDCSASIDAAEQTAKAELPPKLNRVYSAVRASAPRAQIVVVGYPRLVDPGGCPGTISPTEAERLNRGADTLRDQIKQLAQTRGLAYADPIPAFVGHGACGADPWLNGVAPVFVNSFHPNVTGQSQGYAPTVLEAFRSIPQTRIRKPRPKRGQRKVKVRFAGSASAQSFKCRLDDDAYKPCSKPATFKRLKRGKHRVQVYAVNANGDIDQSPASRRFTVRKRHAGS